MLIPPSSSSNPRPPQRLRYSILCQRPPSHLRKDSRNLVHPPPNQPIPPNILRLTTTIKHVRLPSNNHSNAPPSSHPPPHQQQPHRQSPSPPHLRRRNLPLRTRPASSNPNPLQPHNQQNNPESHNHRRPNRRNHSPPPTITLRRTFWQRFPLWPELAAFLFNVMEGQSSAWGTEPWSWYFT